MGCCRHCCYTDFYTVTGVHAFSGIPAAAASKLLLAFHVARVLLLPVSLLILVSDYLFVWALFLWAYTYARTHIGLSVLLPDIIVTSVNILILRGKHHKLSLRTCVLCLNYEGCFFQSKSANNRSSVNAQSKRG